MEAHSANITNCRHLIRNQQVAGSNLAVAPEFLSSFNDLFVASALNTATASQTSTIQNYENGSRTQIFS